MKPQVVSFPALCEAQMLAAVALACKKNIERVLKRWIRVYSTRHQKITGESSTATIVMLSMVP